jgi:hypothetical protein
MANGRWQSAFVQELKKLAQAEQTLREEGQQACCRQRKKYFIHSEDFFLENCSSQADGISR